MTAPATLAVIPAYGDPALTRAVVGDAAREAELVRVLVVDNQGGYEAVRDEEVARPDHNLGWLGACNRGMVVAAAQGCANVVLLNNDTRLSPGFFAGLVAASAALGGAVVAPSYDDRAFRVQHVDVAGGVDAYERRDEDLLVTDVDGTCVLVPVSVVHQVGPLDGRRFGLHGWGAMDDLCLRVRRRGGRIGVTRRSFLSHARATTARVAITRYEHFAMAEMEVGMVRKYGPTWRRHFADDVFGDRRRGDLVLAFARYAQDRLGIPEVEWRRLLTR